jgi:hypothetical protein
MINRLLLVPRSLVNSEFVSEAGLTTVVVGDPVAVKPIAWPNDRVGSCYAFVLSMNLSEWATVKKTIIDKFDTCTILNFKETPEQVKSKQKTDLKLLTPQIPDLLSSVGLEIHPNS